MTPANRLTYDEARARARVLKALGHPVRLMVVDALAAGDVSLSDLYPMFRVRQPTLSRHVAVLKQAGLLTERRAGSRVILHLASPPILRAFDLAREVVRSDHLRRARGAGTVVA